MHISEALTRTYAVAGRLPGPFVTRGPGTPDPAPVLSVAAYRAITAVTGAAGLVGRVFSRRRTQRATVRSLPALDDRIHADHSGQPGARRSGTNIATAAANRPVANDNDADLAA